MLFTGLLISFYPRELLPRQSSAMDICSSADEPLSVSSPPMVEAECLFVNVAEQVEWLDADIGSMKPTLQETPEVFHGICVDVAANILDGVVNDFVRVLSFKADVRQKLIGKDCASGLDVIPD